VDLDSKFPVLFFPIRIETKYNIADDGRKSLKIRFFPDQISIDTFDPRLTKQEKIDAIDYWNAVKSFDQSNAEFENNRDIAWEKLVNKYGCSRSAYISKSVIQYDPAISPDPTNPEFSGVNGIDTQKEEEYVTAVCRLLPRSFRVYGKSRLDNSPKLLGESKPILKDIKVGAFTSDSSDPDIELLDSMKWLTSFKRAEEDGMAIEINLTADMFVNGFEYIFVCGVRDDLTPQETKIVVENLFKSHRYTSGFSFIKQGTPTNLVNGKTEQNNNNNSYSSLSSHFHINAKTCRKLEFSGLFSLESPPSSPIELLPDGRVFEKKLGVDNLASGVYNANNNEQISAAYMGVVLWNAIAGQLLKKLQLSEPILTRLREHFIRYVRAQGSIPSFRIGKVPYGVLPITHFSEWQDSSMIQNYSKYIITFFNHLKDKWLESAREVPTVMNVQNGISPEKQLINILSMEAFSHAYYIRGIRDHKYIGSYISTLVGINPNLLTNRILEANKKITDLMLRSIFHISSILSIPLDLTELYRRIPGSGFTRMTVPNTTEFTTDGGAANPEYLSKMYIDLETFGIASNYLKTTEIQTSISGFLPSPSEDTLLFKLLRYSASILGADLSQVSDNVLKEKLLDESNFKESLKFLSTIGQDDPLNLESLMLQTLDLTSYRLDAWLTSFANQRLDYLRQLDEVTKKGLYIGCYGWIENLKPKQSSNTSESALKKPVYAGGYIQAPSYAHATSAAVLRDGYLTHSNDSDKKDLLKINLSSKRTKDALEIIQNIQNMPLSDLLGYKFERRLHDVELDYLIDEFRKYFPLKKDDIKELESNDEMESSKEKISPRNIVDGFLLYKNWKRLVNGITTLDTTNIKNFMENDDDNSGGNEINGKWRPFYIEIKRKYVGESNGPEENQKIRKIIDRITPHLNYLLDQVDGLTDLCIAESVYQAVNGNYDRSAAVLDGLSGEGQIPTPEISSIPMTSANQIQKIVLATETDPLSELNLLDINDDSTILPWKNPNMIAEPNLNKILKSYYGNILFWINLKDDKGNTILPSVEVTLSDLGLEPIDLLYIKETELKARLKYYGKTSNLLDSNNNSPLVYYCDVENFDKKPAEENDNLDKKSLTELRFMIKSLQNLIGQSQPLKYTDFRSPQEDSSGEDNDPIKIDITRKIIIEIFQRFYNVLFLMARTIGELEEARNNSASMENKRRALVNASSFNLSSDAIPLQNNENILESEILLDEKIGLVINEMHDRLKAIRIEDCKAKLSEWKSKLESEEGGGSLEVLLDVIYRQMQGIEEGEGEINNLLKKYNKLLEMMLSSFKILLNNQSFLIMPPFESPPPDLLVNFEDSSSVKNKKALKWIRKAAFVRPKLKLFDEITIFNQVFESSDFSFYYDKTKFMQNAEYISTAIEDKNPVSLIIAVSNRVGLSQDQMEKFPPTGSKKLAGMIIDEWPEKVVLPKQDTAITFHYDGPSAEAPQCLILAVSPHNSYRWIWDDAEKNTLKDIFVDAMDLMKIRAVDYRSLKELNQFLPTIALNSSGEPVYTRFYQKGVVR